MPIDKAAAQRWQLAAPPLLRKDVSPIGQTLSMGLDDDLIHKLARAEFSLDAIRRGGDGTPSREIEVETHFASVIASLRSIAQYIAERACGWDRLSVWVKRQSFDDQAAWKSLGDLRNQDIHTTVVIPYRVRRGGWFSNYFGPDFFGSHFGGEVVRQVATGHEVIEFSNRCVTLMKRLLNEYRAL